MLQGFQKCIQTHILQLLPSLPPTTGDFSATHKWGSKIGIRPKVDGVGWAFEAKTGNSRQIQVILVKVGKSGGGGGAVAAPAPPLPVENSPVQRLLGEAAATSTCKVELRSYMPYDN